MQDQQKGRHEGDTEQPSIERCRQMEAALRESEQNYRTLANSGQALIWMAGPDKRCSFFNQPWLDFTGRTLEQEYGDGWAAGVHPEDLQRCISTYTGAFNKRERFSMEYRLRRHDGVYRWLLDDGSPRYSSAGEFIGYIGYCLDITALKESSQREQLQLERLMKSEKLASLGTLIAGVAHEINNPNMFIMLNTPIVRGIWDEAVVELEARRMPDQPIRIGLTSLETARQMAEEAFDNIMRGSERIKNIVTELKDYARESSPLQEEPVDVNKVFHAAVALLRNRITCSTDHFQADYADRLPTVHGNPQRLEQVMINLLANACEALPDKACAIRIRTFHEPASNSVVFQVADEGTGMAPDVQSQIANPFFTTKRDSGGTGLGVPISAKIVDEHRGVIHYESAVNKGTTVTVTLPCAPIST